MTEQQAKHLRKLNQAVKDAMKSLPEHYTLDELSNDLVQLKRLEGNPGTRKISTKMVAGLLRWMIEKL